MSLPRLTFLYPHLFKSLLPQEGTSRFQSLCPTPKRVQKAGFSTTPRQRQEIFAQRYGPATELPPPPPEGSKMPSRAQDDKSLAGAIEKEVKGGDRQEEKQPEPTPSEEAVRSKEAVTQADDGSRNESIETALQDPAQRASQLDASKAHSNEEGKPVYKDNAGLKTAKPLATVLEMPAPTVEKPDEHKAPHMQAPPYVHHFDMYTLVKNLGKGDFTEAQSITVMKAVRGLLGTNLEVAREGLVSKSDVENETYLFRAACSELRTEILNARKSSSTKTHTQLSHLQHSFDILSQRVSQESLALKDDLRGMLNDRRMASRMQSQNRDGEISELNYKISVALNSSSKSEVEGLRWVLTRRAAMAIAIMAVLILGSLRYSSYKIHEREIEARKMVGREGGKGKGEEGGGEGGKYTVQSREMGTQTSDAESVNKGENVGYVSLG